MSFYEDLEKSLLETIRIEKGEIALIEKEGMPAPSFYVNEVGQTDLIDAAVQNARAHAEWRSEYMSLLLRDLEMKEEGREEGIEEGRLQQLFELVQEGDISLEVALKRTTLSEKEFVDQMNQYVEKK